MSKKHKEKKSKKQKMEVTTPKMPGRIFVYDSGYHMTAYKDMAELFDGDFVGDYKLVGVYELEKVGEVSVPPIEPVLKELK